MKRISKKERRKAALNLLNDQLFCDMHKTLTELGELYDDLSAPEVWDEAKTFLQDYCQNTHPSDTIVFLTEEMEDRYATFEEDGNCRKRTKEEVKRTIFLVFETMLFMLCAEANDKSVNPYMEHCEVLVKVTFNHPLREIFIEDVKAKEDLEEKAGRRVGVVNYLLDDVSKDKLNETEIRQAQDEVMHKLVDVVLDMDDNIIAAHERSLGRLSRNNNHRFDSHLKRLAEKSKERVEQKGGDTIMGDKNEFNGNSAHNTIALPPNMSPQDAVKLLQVESKENGEEG